MHTEYISVSKHTIEKRIAHNGKAIAVGTTSVRTLESLYYIGVLISHNPDANATNCMYNNGCPTKIRMTLNSGGSTATDSGLSEPTRNGSVA